jgi:hypothetical protein
MFALSFEQRFGSNLFLPFGAQLDGMSKLRRRGDFSQQGGGLCSHISADLLWAHSDGNASAGYYQRVCYLKDAVSHKPRVLRHRAFA